MGRTDPCLSKGGGLWWCQTTDRAKGEEKLSGACPGMVSLVNSAKQD